VVLESGFFGTEIGRVELLRSRDSRSWLRAFRYWS